MKVRTSFWDCNYITPEKTYDVIGYENEFLIIVCDSGEEIIIALDDAGCAHLDWNTAWEIVEENI